MKILCAFVLLINLNLYTMEVDKKNKKTYHHHKHNQHKHHHHNHHDKLIIYPDVDKKDIHIVLTDPEFKQKKEEANEGLFSKSLSAITAAFRYLGQ